MRSRPNLFVLNLIIIIDPMIVLINTKVLRNVLLLVIPLIESTLLATLMILPIPNIMLLVIVAPQISLIIFTYNASLKLNNLHFVLPKLSLFITVLLPGSQTLTSFQNQFLKKSFLLGPLNTHTLYFVATVSSNASLHSITGIGLKLNAFFTIIPKIYPLKHLIMIQNHTLAFAC